MPSRRLAGASGSTQRRKHSLGNLRRAHPASGATWNVQVVRGKMSSKCLWHACRALILGLTLMLLGAGMATLGYYADHLSINTELRGNSTIRIKNDLKGLHLNNFSYVGPIVMGFGGFIVVASCVMTFEARDSAAKVVPARLRAGTSNKSTVRSNQSSSASQRRPGGMHMYTRWDHQFGVFRSSPADAPVPQPAAATFDREALTAELIKFSKSLSASVRFSPKLRRLTYAGSVPELSTTTQTTHPLAYSTNISHLLSPKYKPLLLSDDKYSLTHQHRHYRHHHHSNSKHHRHHHQYSSSGRQVKPRVTRVNSIVAQSRAVTRENSICTLLQPPTNRIYWHASSFDESCRDIKMMQRTGDHPPNRRSDTAKRHVLSRQKPIEHEEDQISPLGNRRNSTMSDSQFNSRHCPMRCASTDMRTSSIDSRRIQVDLHSPEIVPKSILRSPKRYNSGPSATPSVEREFRSQLSVCSEPPAAIHQLSGQSSLEPCVPEESTDFTADQTTTDQTTTTDILPTPPDSVAIAIDTNNSITSTKSITECDVALKKCRPDSLPIKNIDSVVLNMSPTATEPATSVQSTVKSLQRSTSSRSFYRPPRAPTKERDDSIFYIKSAETDLYDFCRVISERRSTLLRAESDTALAEPSRINFTCMQNIPEHTVEDNKEKN